MAAPTAVKGSMIGKLRAYAMITNSNRCTVGNVTPVKERTPRDTAAKDQFARRIRDLGHRIELDPVIARDNVYRVGDDVHLMVRTSRFHDRRSVYFFGLTKHIFENFAALPNAVICFVLADSGEALLLPASWMWQHRSRLSADSKQYKLEIDRRLRLKTPQGGAAGIDLTPFREQFALLNPSGTTTSPHPARNAVSVKHAEIQGMLLEVGNARGFQTYSPNKSPRFNNKPLGEIATLRAFPEFPGLNNAMVQQIDVLWLEKSFPVHAFEVELTTGIWSGLVRLAELKRLNTVFHVITDTDGATFRRRISGDIFSDLVQRCHHASCGDIRNLYDAETRLEVLRKKILV